MLSVIPMLFIIISLTEAHNIRQQDSEAIPETEKNAD